MHPLLKKNSAPDSPAPTPTLRDVDDPADLAAFVRAALVNPRDAAAVLAHYPDCKCTHHEGCEVSRTIDTWAYDPTDDSFDAMAWYAGQGWRMSRAVRVALCAVVAGARRARPS